MICAVNAICWSLITPAFQVPDEVDHFAYVASIATHLRSPDTVPSARARWSSAETDAIAATNFLTDHYTDDSRAPWLAVDVASYNGLVASTHPSDGDGGGLETAASHGPLYYLALAPGFLLAGAGHVFSQLGLARLISALIGSIAALCTYLMCLEFAPRKRWLAVLAALLVSFEPMYGFISGGVNNDVGINAGAAALELLLLRMSRAASRSAARSRQAWCSRCCRSSRGRVLALSGGRAVFVSRSVACCGACGPPAGPSASPRALRGGARGGRFRLRSRSGRSAGADLPFADRAASGPRFDRPRWACSAPLSLLSLLWQVLLPRLPFLHAHFAGARLPLQGDLRDPRLRRFGFYTILFPYLGDYLIEARWTRFRLRRRSRLVRERDSFPPSRDRAGAARLNGRRPSSPSSSRSPTVRLRSSTSFPLWALALTGFRSARGPRGRASTRSLAASAPWIGGRGPGRDARAGSYDVPMQTDGVHRLTGDYRVW